jgi:hypothetical protein
MLKIDVDVVETVMRLRGAHGFAVDQPEESHDRQRTVPESEQGDG